MKHEHMHPSRSTRERTNVLVSHNRYHVVTAANTLTLAMGGGSSRKGEEKPCARPPHSAGKFLLQTLCNASLSTDGAGGTYLSCSAEGVLTSMTTENDPELWRLSYVEGDTATKHDLFRLQNTGRKRILRADGPLLSCSEGSESSNELFYLLGTPNDEYYFIRSNASNAFLSHSKDGTIMLLADRTAESCYWKLIPSF